MCLGRSVINGSTDDTCDQNGAKISQAKLFQHVKKIRTAENNTQLYGELQEARLNGIN